MSQSVSLLIHELQKERGSSAGFLGAKGGGDFYNILVAQRQSTDKVLQAFENSIAEHLDAVNDPILKEDYIHIEEKLAVVLEHRTGVSNLKYSLAETVQPYTQTINELLMFIADSAHSATGANDTAANLAAFITLMEAKENAGIERAVGSNSFASGVMSPDLHRKAIGLAAKQEAYFHEFSLLMGHTQWAKQLAALKEENDWKAVEQAREALVNGGYQETADQLNSLTGPQWFELTTRRIDLLMQLETDLGQAIRAAAKDHQNVFNTQAQLSMFAASGVFLLALFVSTIMVMSVTKPLKQVSSQLGRLADGDLDVEVSGTERKDEIGVLACAAAEFLESSQERNLMLAEKAKAEEKEMNERRALMQDMAGPVEAATTTSVGEIVKVAEELVVNSDSMKQELYAARQNANEVNESARETLLSTEQAADLANDLSAAITEVAENVSKSDELARTTVDLAEQSATSVEELDGAANQIGDFVNIITELAEQTNLLALNATIESARAGEAGRGFSIVASEIKQLAAQTNKSADQISERVQHIQSKTSNAVETIGRITDSINSLGDVTSSVAAAVEEQRASTQSFSSFLMSNKQALSTVADKIGQLSDIADQSATNAGMFGELIAGMTASSKQANETIPKIIQTALDAAERRSAERVSFNGKPFQIHDGKSSRPAELIDVSATGAKISGYISGDNVELEVSGLKRRIKAKVKWANQKIAGVEFEKQLTEDQLTRIGFWQAKLKTEKLNAA
jgi:methyl-accepting chemotaxis protein